MKFQVSSFRKRAVFLDRDGVINVDSPDYIRSWEDFHFAADIFDVLRELAATDYLIIIVSNQSAIGRGLTTDANVREIHARMRTTIEENGGRLDAVYYCPHTPEDRCGCRKPEPAMILRAAAEFDIDLRNSFMIGDKMSDVEAGKKAGARTIILQAGSDPPCRANSNGGLSPEYRAQTLHDALRYILAPLSGEAH